MVSARLAEGARKASAHFLAAEAADVPLLPKQWFASHLGLQTAGTAGGPGGGSLEGLTLDLARSLYQWALQAWHGVDSEASAQEQLYKHGASAFDQANHAQVVDYLQGALYGRKDGDSAAAGNQWVPRTFAEWITDLATQGTVTAKAIYQWALQAWHGVSSEASAQEQLYRHGAAAFNEANHAQAVDYMQAALYGRKDGDSVAAGGQWIPKTFAEWLASLSDWFSSATATSLRWLWQKVRSPAPNRAGDTIALLQSDATSTQSTWAANPAGISDYLSAIVFDHHKPALGRRAASQGRPAITYFRTQKWDEIFSGIVAWWSDAVSWFSSTVTNGLQWLWQHVRSPAARTSGDSVGLLAPSATTTVRTNASLTDYLSAIVFGHSDADMGRTASITTSWYRTKTWTEVLTGMFDWWPGSEDWIRRITAAAGRWISGAASVLQSWFSSAGGASGQQQEEELELPSGAQAQQVDPHPPHTAADFTKALIYGLFGGAHTTIEAAIESLIEAGEPLRTFLDGIFQPKGADTADLQALTTPLKWASSVGSSAMSAGERGLVFATGSARFQMDGTTDQFDFNLGPARRALVIGNRWLGLGPTLADRRIGYDSAVQLYKRLEFAAADLGSNSASIGRDAGGNMYFKVPATDDKFHFQGLQNTDFLEVQRGKIKIPTINAAQDISGDSDGTLAISSTTTGQTILAKVNGVVRDLASIPAALSPTPPPPVTDRLRVYRVPGQFAYRATAAQLDAAFGTDTGTIGLVVSGRSATYRTSERARDVFRIALRKTSSWQLMRPSDWLISTLPGTPTTISPTSLESNGAPNSNRAHYISGSGELPTRSALGGIGLVRGRPFLYDETDDADDGALGWLPAAANTAAVVRNLSGSDTLRSGASAAPAVATAPLLGDLPITTIRTALPAALDGALTGAGRTPGTASLIARASSGRYWLYIRLVTGIYITLVMTYSAIAA